MSKSAEELAADILDEIQSLQQEFKDPDYEEVYIQPEIIDNVENEMLSVSTIKSIKNEGMNKHLMLISKELKMLRF